MSYEKDINKEPPMCRISRGYSLDWKTIAWIEEEAERQGMPKGRFLDKVIASYSQKHEQESLEVAIALEDVAEMSERLGQLEADVGFIKECLMALMDSKQIQKAQTARRRNSTGKF